MHAIKNQKSPSLIKMLKLLYTKIQKNLYAIPRVFIIRLLYGNFDIPLERFVGQKISTFLKRSRKNFTQGSKKHM